MKKIKIFLASSIEDLKEDRLQIGDYFRQLNEIYLDSGVHFSLVKCEDYDNAIVSGGKQSAYDREIAESDLCFFLFFRKVGDYTRHEFDVALQSFQAKDKPKIVTYIKYVNNIGEAQGDVLAFMQMLDAELHHYYNTYGHIDTLKLDILMQIKLMKLDASEICIKDGEIQLNGQTVAKTENVPMLDGNQTLKTLTQEKRRLQEELTARRAAYLAEPTEENESVFFDASAALNQVSKRLIEVEKEALSFATTVAELTGDGKVLTYRQREALKYFNAGDYTAAQLILEDEERENELKRAENRAESGKNEIQGYIEEDLLWIEAEKTCEMTEERAGKIIEKYEKAVSLAEKYDLDKRVLYGLAEILGMQRRFDEAICIAEKLKWYYQKPNAEAGDVAVSKLLNLLGSLYNETQRLDEAEQAYLSALEISKKLSEKNPDVYEPNVALSYNNLGFLYCKTLRFEEAADAFAAAEEIYEKLRENNNADEYTLFLAGSTMNMGNLFSQVLLYDEAEQAYLSALELNEELSEKNPERYEPALALNYQNLGMLYVSMERFEEAEELLLSAMEINKDWAQKNPDSCEPDLAVNYNNLGILCHKIGRVDEAAEFYSLSTKIYEKFSRKNSEAYAPILAQCYENLGIFYADMQEFDEAEAFLLLAAKTNESLCEKNLDVYGMNLVRNYLSLGGLYSQTEQNEKAKEVYSAAMDLCQKAKENGLEGFQEAIIDFLENMVANESD